MPFVTPALLTVIGLTGVLAQIGAGLINAGIVVGLSYVAKALQPATKVETGIKTSIQLGGDQPRGCVFGECGIDGHFVYGNTANENNNLLQFVFAIGEGVHDDLTRIWVNGKARTLTLVEQTTWYKKFRVGGFVAKNGTPLLYVYFYFGFENQPACPELVEWAKPADRWTSNDRMAGISYVVVSAFYGEQAFDSGIPRFRFGIRGRRLYDWRKDSTNGGSGAHRWSDATTWEYSENPIVQLYNYQRGIHLGGDLVVGMGVPPVDLVLDRYTAAANACDEPVSTAEGSDANRYRCSTYVSADEEHGTVMERLLDSCIGSLYERVGAYAPIVGVAQSVLYTFTDTDLITDYPVSFAAKLGRADLVNEIHGQRVSPADQFGMVSYATRTDAAAVAADTEKRPIQVDFPQVTVDSQAQRMAQIQLNLARLQATATLTLGLSAIVLEPGDWVRWNSARRGDRTFIILSLVENTDETVTLNLREISAAAFGWDSGDELPAPATGGPSEGGGLADGVTGFSLSALTLTGDGGALTPAVRMFWTPINDPTVTAVLIQYRIVGTTNVLTARAEAVGAGELLVSAGLVANTAYEFQATIETAPARDTVWTAWTGITTGQQLAGGVVNDSITPAQMTAATRDLVVTLTQTALASVRASLAQLSLIVADVDAAGDLNKRELARSLTIQLGAAVASFNELITVAVGPESAIVTQLTELQASFEATTASLSASLGTETAARVSGDSALAVQITDLAATVGDIDATLSVTYVADVVPSGALAAYRIKATAEDAEGGLLIVAKSGGGGNYSEVWIDATRFLVTGPGASGTPVFLVDTSDPLSPVIVLNGAVVAPESITAGKLNVATLSAIVANLGEITAGVARSADNRLRIDFNNARIVISS
ncbi:phage tail protein [Xanthobacter aminoxidans]|uniref:phage tail protein n=1 Tax=Xanthobacter aminoxidans TaxID=186280 RepID=UPI00372BA800